MTGQPAPGSWSDTRGQSAYLPASIYLFYAPQSIQSSGVTNLALCSPLQQGGFLLCFGFQVFSLTAFLLHGHPGRKLRLLPIDSKDSIKNTASFSCTCHNYFAFSLLQLAKLYSILYSTAPAISTAPLPYFTAPPQQKSKPAQGVITLNGLKKTKFLIVSPGFEPRQRESKSLVLPLHHETTQMRCKAHAPCGVLCTTRYRFMQA